MKHASTESCVAHRKGRRVGKRARFGRCMHRINRNEIQILDVRHCQRVLGEWDLERLKAIVKIGIPR